MKRLLVVLIALVAIFAMVLPAVAADFKFGGIFYTRYYAFDNIKDGNSDLNDSGSTMLYTRMRLYFNAIASENLKAVAKVEMDSVWGKGRIGRVSVDGGSDGRADSVGVTDTAGSSLTVTSAASANSGFEIKNAYIDFNIPDTPLNFVVGLAGTKLGGSGITFNDDTPVIRAQYVYSPMRFQLFYTRINDLAPAPGTGVSANSIDISSDDYHGFGFDFRYRQEAFNVNLDLMYVKTSSATNANSVDATKNDFDLFNIGVDLDYKADLWNAYLTAAFNSGEDETNTLRSSSTQGGGTFSSTTAQGSDFGGFLITAGGNYNFTDMISAGLDFYFASGNDNAVTTDSDMDAYQTYGVIGRPSYNMDDVVFPGWFDDVTTTNTTGSLAEGTKLNNVTSTGLTATNQNYTPNNILAIGAHADFKPLDQTFVQAYIAYMKFHEDVLANSVTGELDDSLGFSLGARLNQGITDGLAFKAVFGYLVADDGFSSDPSDDNALKFAAGVQWSW